MPALVWTVTVVAVVAWLGVEYALVRRDSLSRSRHDALQVLAVLATACGIGLVLLFCRGSAYALNFGSELVTQYTLTIDLSFVFVTLTTVFAVPRIHRRRLILLAVAGAITVKGAMTLLGAWLSASFAWILFFSGALLVLRAVLLVATPDGEGESSPRMGRFLARVGLEVTQDYEGRRMLTRRGGKLMATPMMLVLLSLVTTDLLFVPEAGDPYLMFLATTLSLLLMKPMCHLLVEYYPLRNLLRLGKVLSVVLLVYAAKLTFAAFGSLGILRTWGAHLPLDLFRDSLWLPLLMGVIVGCALYRLIEARFFPEVGSGSQRE